MTFRPVVIGRSTFPAFSAALSSCWQTKVRYLNSDRGPIAPTETAPNTGSPYLRGHRNLACRTRFRAASSVPDPRRARKSCSCDLRCGRSSIRRFRTRAAHTALYYDITLVHAFRYQVRTATLSIVKTRTHTTSHSCTHFSHASSTGLMTIRRFRRCPS